jgi:hypothetical protein
LLHPILRFRNGNKNPRLQHEDEEPDQVTRMASYFKVWDPDGDSWDRVEVVRQVGMDIEADNLVEGIDTSKDGKADTPQVVLVFGALALGFVLRMRSQNRH